jgi:hypothetical protein
MPDDTERDDYTYEELVEMYDVPTSCTFEIDEDTYKTEIEAYVDTDLPATEIVAEHIVKALSDTHGWLIDDIEIEIEPYEELNDNLITPPSLEEQEREWRDRVQLITGLPYTEIHRRDTTDPHLTEMGAWGSESLRYTMEAELEGVTFTDTPKGNPRYWVIQPR